MHFLLQDSGIIDIDTAIIEEILQRRKRIDSYEKMTLQSLYETNRNEVKRAVPIGTIQFVESWLKKCHNIDRINPIEVPECLRTEEFLKRDYRIVPFSEIPAGEYFVKDVSALKRFVYFGDTERLFTGKEGGRVDSTHLFQVSEIENVLSEYRVYVIDGKIENVCNYDGSPLLYPDMDLICRANQRYMTRHDYPKSLTIDVMITKKGTEIIEIHPFISCGLYSTLWGDNLLTAYRDGIDYVVRHNTRIRVSKS